MFKRLSITLVLFMQVSYASDFTLFIDQPVYDELAAKNLTNKQQEKVLDSLNDAYGWFGLGDDGIDCRTVVPTIKVINVSTDIIELEFESIQDVMIYGCGLRANCSMTVPLTDGRFDFEIDCDYNL